MIRSLNRSLLTVVLGFMLILAVAVALHSCGPAPIQTAAAPAPTSDPAWAALAPTVQKDCGPCHNGSMEPAFTSGAVFKASTAKRQLEAGTMPPPGHVLAAADKQAMLDYLGK